MVHPADDIRLFHGTILGEKDSVYLVYFGDYDIMSFGIGCMVRNTETGEEKCWLKTYDVPNAIKQEQIDDLHAHPETFGELLRT